jgi:ethanolamine transporter EutH
MKKIIITYGLIAGTIVAALMLITIPLMEKDTVDFKYGELLGYTTMVIALSMIFFGIKSYRDNHADGAVSFWKGVQIGILITLIAGVMYCLAWETLYRRMGSDFMNRMTDQYYEEMKADGATDAELEEAKAEWSSFSEMYKNPVIRFGVTLTEILPVGVILTLISAGLLRKKNFLPTSSSSGQ